MKDINKHIDQLFAMAKTEEPRLASDRILKQLQETISSNHGETKNNISNFKFIIMIVSISTITLSAFMFITSPTFNHTETFKVEDAVSIGTESAKTLDSKDVNIPNPEPVLEEEPIMENNFDEKSGNLTQTISSKVDKATDYSPVEKPIFGGKKQFSPLGHNALKEKDNSESVLGSRIFQLDSNIKAAQLQIIKREAEKAGISFKYKTRGNGTLKRLEMVIETESSKSVHKLMVDKEDVTQIGWVVDKDQKAIRFYDREKEIELASEAAKKPQESFRMKVIDFEKRVIKESMRFLKDR